MRLITITVLSLVLSGCGATSSARPPAAETMPASPSVETLPASPSVDAHSQAEAQAAADTCAANKAGDDDAKVTQIAAGLAGATGVTGQLYLDVRKHADADTRYLADNNTSMAIGYPPGGPPTAEQQAATGRLDQDSTELAPLLQ